jgi:hypothetical protein
MKTRNGKIARLSREVRDELNRRLERSQPGPNLLDWLNGLPEVRELLQEQFEGEPISKQNLSQWRQGGFQEWLARQELWQAAVDANDFATDWGDNDGGPTLPDQVATVLAARFAALVLHWNGQCTPEFEARSRALSRLSRSVVALQRETRHVFRERLEAERLRQEQEQRETEELKDRLTGPIMDLMKVKPLSKMFGDGPIGRKLADYVLAVRRGNLDAKLDLEPADTLTAPEKKNRQKRRKNVAAEVEAEEPASAAGPSASNPVKVSQSDESDASRDASEFPANQAESCQSPSTASDATQ